MLAVAQNVGDARGSQVNLPVWVVQLCRHHREALVQPLHEPGQKRMIPEVGNQRHFRVLAHCLSPKKPRAAR